MVTIFFVDFCSLSRYLSEAGRICYISLIVFSEFASTPPVVSSFDLFIMYHTTICLDFHVSCKFVFKILAMPGYFDLDPLSPFDLPTYDSR